MNSYYAVIFTSKQSDTLQDYNETAQKMELLASKQEGFLGFETAREQKFGISISYWETLESIENWKYNSEHLIAQHLGKVKWYDQYHIRICKVEREYQHQKQ
ncbi:antibiotic biosynthesis monooxygenase family protein [Mangrovimonas aestuarii]|uniref:antibiotic biosynthesis monooxygenase family protein n=1 Tax=Mangrovimonas aestuarii TaxID=3018443 RepID=UPI00237967E0|nr:antibiotic biosynthesis monooxygenase [Mangrovimonas aestuarii]